MSYLPDKYKQAVKILNQIKAQKCSLKKSISLLDSTKHNTKAIYALIINVLKNQVIIDKWINSFFINQNNLNLTLIKIIIGKVKFEKRCLRKSLPVNVPEVQAVLENIHHFKKLKKNKDKKSEIKYDSKELMIRYLRINRIKSDIQQVIQFLKQQKFIFISLEIQSFESFKDKCASLKKNEFIIDYHFPQDFLIFNAVNLSKLMELEIYKNGNVIVQDKASFLAIEAMNLKPGMKILDVCCAPGMKTSAIASHLNNKVHILSIDKSKERLKEMKKIIKKLNVTCCEIMNSDFVDCSFQFKSQSIDVILLDPTCSGSGLQDRLKEQTDPQRLGKLASFQTLMLKKALEVEPKRIVYSTCSLHIMENENVIKSALKESPFSVSYEIVDAVPFWPKRGKGNYPFSSKCVRSDYEHLTKGFFVAVLEKKRKKK